MPTTDSALPGLRRPQKRLINRLANDILARQFARVREQLLRELAEEVADGAEIETAIARRRMALLRADSEVPA